MHWTQNKSQLKIYQLDRSGPVLNKSESQIPVFRCVRGVNSLHWGRSKAVVFYCVMTPFQNVRI
jgi:hypothetical protein